MHISFNNNNLIFLITNEITKKFGEFMSISVIAKSIETSPTLALNERFSILKAKGEPVIHLGGGEPKSKSPMDAILAASAHLGSGEIRYTPSEGTIDLKQSVIRFTEENYKTKISPRNILVSYGAKQSIMSALQTILNPQEEVIFPAPYWVSYPDMVKITGGIPVPVHPEDGSFLPTAEDIINHVSSYTKAIILNSPNNPTGAVYSKEFIAEIVEYCEKKDIYLIMDDIYMRLLFDGLKPIIVTDFTTKDIEESKLIIINGVSKMYAMTGLRVGWAVASKKLIEVMANIQGHQTSGVSVVLQKAAVGALNGIQSFVENLRLTLENNRNIMIDRLNSFEGVRVYKPHGTFYCMADFSYYEKNSLKLSEMLIDKVKVLTVPGIAFGLDGHLRLSYCGSVKEITEGIERMKWALDLNSPNELYIGDRKLVRDRI